MGAFGAAPGPGTEKAAYIRQLFDTIAPGYDRMNRLMTLGQWRYWQWRLARRLEELPLEGARVLDVACGTGEITALLARRVGPSGHVTGLDFSPGMLAVARRRLEEAGLAARVRLVQGDALAMPFPDGGFDLVTMGFALRNVADLDRALAEMVRVARPGDGCCCSSSPTARGPGCGCPSAGTSSGWCRPWGDGRPAAGGAGTGPLRVAAPVGAGLPGGGGARRPHGGGGPGGRAVLADVGRHRLPPRGAAARGDVRVRWA